VYYHDPDFQRQRHRERVAEMRETYRRSSRIERSSHRHSPADRIQSIWQRIRRRSVRRAPAYRA
jgi:hypothetical protein